MHCTQIRNSLAFLGWNGSKYLIQTQSSASRRGSVGHRADGCREHDGAPCHCCYCGNTGGICVLVRPMWSVIPQAREACHHMPTLYFLTHLFVCPSLHYANMNPPHICGSHPFVFITLSPTEHPGKKTNKQKPLQCQQNSLVFTNSILNEEAPTHGKKSLKV